MKIQLVFLRTLDFNILLIVIGILHIDFPIIYIHLSTIYTSAAELWYMLIITAFPFQIQILWIGEHHLLIKLLLIQTA